MAFQEKKTDSCCDLDLKALLLPKLFQALCDPTRIAILCELLKSHAPQSVGTVAAACPIDVSVVSRHLSVLRDAGILSREKRGKEAFYRVEAAGLADTLRSIADALERMAKAST